MLRFEGSILLWRQEESHTLLSPLLYLWCWRWFKMWYEAFLLLYLDIILLWLRMMSGTFCFSDDLVKCLPLPVSYAWWKKDWMEWQLNALWRACTFILGSRHGKMLWWRSLVTACWCLSESRLLWEVWLFLQKNVEENEILRDVWVCNGFHVLGKSSSRVVLITPSPHPTDSFLTYKRM